MNDDCPIPTRPCPFDQKEFEHLCRQIDQIHAFLFGIESQGGLVRKVEVMEQVLIARATTVEARVTSLETFRLKVASWAAGAAAVVTFLFNKAWDWFN